MQPHSLTRLGSCRWFSKQLPRLLTAIQQVTHEAARVAAQEAASVAAQEVARQLAAGQQIPPQEIPPQ